MLSGSHTFIYKSHQWSIIERSCDRSCKSFALVYVSQKTYLTHIKITAKNDQRWLLPDSKLDC